MIIEVVGTPGAGKTTVATGVAAELAGWGYRSGSLRTDTDGSRSERLSAALSRPALTAHLLASVRIPDWRTDLAVLGRLLWRDRLAEELDDGTVLDSGVVFGAAAALRWLPLDVDRLVDVLHLPDLVVDLRLAPPVAVERVRQRDDGHGVGAMERDEALAYMVAYRSAMDRVLVAADLPTIRVDVAEAPPQDVVHTVARQLQLRWL